MQSLAIIRVFLVFFVIVGVQHAVSVEGIHLSEACSGSRGVAFSDFNSGKFEQVASSITIRSGGTYSTLALEHGEYVISMEIHWVKKCTSTRVFFLKFVTSEGNSVSGRTTTENNATVTAPDGFQLSGFFGRAESAIDQLGVIWTRIDATTAALTDTMGSDWYGTRIRNWVMRRSRTTASRNAHVIPRGVLPGVYPTK
ncbi:hypothetical protein PC129_g2698 [Phytophthora cactorum]|uniref:Jacalin-type lectin domain-containing protein n=1 Tax=Phytophthora cactorum TaxID=29920 RepID=A0A8T1INN7_9STRA|nr:hypothetical protein PC129_g2698 [Phytophthora cactorum]